MNATPHKPIPGTPPTSQPPKPTRDQVMETIGGLHLISARVDLGSETKDVIRDAINQLRALAPPMA
jgi:hypothetical protein